MPAAVLAALAIAATSRSALSPTCSLLTNTEVAKALDAKVQTRQSSGLMCEWRSVPLGKLTSANRTLELDVASLKEGEFRRLQQRDPRISRLRGVGQLAYIAPDGNGSYVLYVWQNEVYVEVSAVGVSTPLATETKLAKLVLARL